MKHFLPLLAVCLLLLGCSDDSHHSSSSSSTSPSINEAVDSTLSDQTNLQNPQLSASEESAISEVEEPTVFLPTVDSSRFQFFDFDLGTISTERKDFEVMYADPSVVPTGSSDTINTYIELGSDISGHFYYLRDLEDGVKEVKLYQRYITSMSLSDGDGKHRDLLGFKHHISDWEELEMMGDTAITPQFIREETTQFPEVTRREVIREVKRITKDGSDYERKYWLDIAKAFKKPTQSPADVGISEIQLKLVFQQEDGTTALRFIKFKVPMGC